jgi:putative transposase
VRRAITYRPYPNKQQASLLIEQLEECRWLYNHLLEERKTNWEQRQESLRLYDQQVTLPALKAGRTSLAQVNAQVLQNVAVRIDLAFQALVRRVKSGETPGYPRLYRHNRYDSLTYPQAPSGCQLDSEAKRLRLHGVSPVTIMLHRPLVGTPKTATISPAGAAPASGTPASPASARSRVRCLPRVSNSALMWDGRHSPPSRRARR